MLEKRVGAILAHMTTAQKVGQLIQVNMRMATPDDVRRYHLGSIMASGNSGPNGQEFGTPRQWLAAADAYYRASKDSRNGNVGVPVLFGFDAVHGANKIIGATLFPQNIGLGAARDLALVREVGADTAEEMRAAGIAWTFAPSVSVPQDLRWGRTYEGYAEDPALVARDARAAIEGLQGVPGTHAFLGAAHVIATAKHFIGDGATRDGVDRGNAAVSEARLRNVAAGSFVAAVDAGVQSVMVSLSRWHGLPVLANRSLLTGVLKERMRFGGIVLGDWDAQGQVPGCSVANCPQAFTNGADMLMASDDWRGLYSNTLREAEAGMIAMHRIDDAVARILRVKLRLGLLDGGSPSSQPLAGHFDLIGSAVHRTLARRAVRESLVLLKNADRILPLNPDQRVLIAGKGANDIAMQCGGWTLDWQGDNLTNANFPGAQSIWDGLRAKVDAAGGHAELSVDGSYARKPDVAIVVFGETPYAEYVGDLKTVAYTGAPYDLQLVQRLRRHGIPVVAVFLTGRPLYVTPIIDAVSAFVVAWLPGSEGEGIADVLLRDGDGRIVHDFRGKLPYAWPRTPTQGPRDVRKNGRALFPFGSGLTYAYPRAIRHVRVTPAMRGRASH